MHKPTIALLTAAPLIALAVAGCGSSDSTESTATTAALTKAVFVKQANAICAGGNKATNKRSPRSRRTPRKRRRSRSSKPPSSPPCRLRSRGYGTSPLPKATNRRLPTCSHLAQADLKKVEGNPTLVFANKDQFADFAKIAHPYGLTECDPEEN